MQKEIAVGLTEVKRARASRKLLHFTHYTKPDYQAGWVHEEIAERLDQFLKDVEAKRSPRLMIFMPPRHGKTELVSRRLPALAFGLNPDLQIIATSYGADFAAGINRNVQRIIDSEEYKNLFPDTMLAGTKMRRINHSGARGYLRTTDIFEIVGHHGMYRSTGVGGGITGMGADILILDDPIKDAEQADSTTYREKTWEWYLSTAYTRLSPGGGVLLCVTRWNEDDLPGRLLEAQKVGGDQWDCIAYPAMAEQKEAHRKVGEALHEERWPLERLQAIKGSYKGTYGARMWASLYQQRPSPSEGGILKRAWWKFFDEPPMPMEEIIQSWDCSFKDLKTSSYVVGQIWGRKGANKYLLDQVRDQMDFPATIAAIRMMTRKWPKARGKLIEDKANGIAVIQVLKNEIPGIIPVEPKGGKEARAQAISWDIEAGNVFLPNNAQWAHDFVEECALFPNGAHDDQVDAMSQALVRLGSKRSYANVSLSGNEDFARESPNYVF